MSAEEVYIDKSVFNLYANVQVKVDGRLSDQSIEDLKGEIASTLQSFILKNLTTEIAPQEEVKGIFAAVQIDGDINWRN